MRRRFNTIYTTAYVGDVDVEIDTDNLICELNDGELIDEMKNRGLSFPEIESRLYYLEGDKLYRILCDVVEVNYHTPKDEVLKLLAKKF